jgi:hypothetical protein
MDARSPDPVEGNEGSTPDLLNVRPFIEEAVRQQRERLTRLFVETAAPPWLDATQPHWGAPDYLWELCLDSLSPEALNALLVDPVGLADVLVDTWRAWRAKWIAGEWCR